MPRRPRRHPGRKARIAGDKWADRFYHPMPKPAPEFLCPIQEAWDALADWAKERAVSEQARTKGGKPPVCPDCEKDVITYPFHAVESYRGVWCRPCGYARDAREREARHAQAG